MLVNVAFSLFDHNDNFLITLYFKTVLDADFNYSYWVARFESLQFLMLGWEVSSISLLSFKYKQKQQFITEMSLQLMQILEYVAPSSGHIK